MLSRFSIYLEEVVRRGSIRRASEHLNIAPSAINRHILRMEEKLGVPLFERMPRGMRLTSAGELLVDTIRRWRRDMRNLEAQIDQLRGLRRGAVSLALVESSSELVSRCLQQFSLLYPGIVFHLHLATSDRVVDQVLKSEADIGIAFNPPDRHELRVAQTLVYQIGAVMRPDHPLARGAKVSLDECAEHPLVGPDESNALYAILERAWASKVGGSPRFAVTANSMSLIRSLVLKGAGIGFLTPVDVSAELEDGRLKFAPLARTPLPLSVLSLITASSRPPSPAADLLLRHLTEAMFLESSPAVD